MSSLIDVLLSDPDEGLRAVAASALGDLTLSDSFQAEREVVLSALERALRDPSAHVQVAADRALSRLTTPSTAAL
jgi:HEAT repeat protein